MKKLIKKILKEEVDKDYEGLVDGDIVLNGHHRYIASILADVEIDVFNWTRNHNQLIFKWSDVKLITIDYDSVDEIEYHNFIDAKRHSMSVDDIERILNE